MRQPRLAAGLVSTVNGPSTDPPMNAEPEREAEPQVAEDLRETITRPRPRHRPRQQDPRGQGGRDLPLLRPRGKPRSRWRLRARASTTGTRGSCRSSAWTVSGRDPVLLSSSSERGYMSYVDLTNPDLYDGDEIAVRQQTLNIRRIRAINGRLFERVRVKNYNPHAVRARSRVLDFGADFADIFEVRGMAREKRASDSSRPGWRRTRSSSATWAATASPATRVEFASAAGRDRGRRRRRPRRCSGCSWVRTRPS